VLSLCSLLAAATGGKLSIAIAVLVHLIDKPMYAEMQSVHVLAIVGNRQKLSRCRDDIEIG
jgi:hypothetical protein